jgi:hypothetical protein
MKYGGWSNEGIKRLKVEDGVNKKLLNRHYQADKGYNQKVQEEATNHNGQWRRAIARNSLRSFKWQKTDIETTIVFNRKEQKMR